MFKKVDYRRKWLWNSRNVNIGSWNNSNKFSDIFKINNPLQKFTHYSSKQFQRCKLIGLLKCEKGLVNSIEFLIYITIILFLLFGGMDYYITETQHDMLEHIKDYYLNRLKLEGRITDDLRRDMYDRLDSIGFKDITIGVFDYEGNRLDSSMTKVRNIEEVDKSVMKLVISVKPKYKPFLFGKLLGLEENDEFFFKVGGEVLSERPMF